MDSTMLWVYRVAWVVLVLLVLINLPACNTVHGFGMDLINLSKGVDKTHNIGFN